MVTSDRRSTSLVCAFGLTGALLVSGSLAAEIETGTDVKVHWDTTLKYSAAWRVRGQSPTFLGNPNTDDGDRNLRKGLISNRADVFSELDLTYRNVGARLSGAGWYDSVYNRSTDNNSPATANSVSVAFDEFTGATRRLHGRKAEFLDAFVFGKGEIGSTPASFRAGKHTLLWGESLLLADNGIAYAQAPLDFIKAASVPNSQAKELFMPVGQVSGQVRPRLDLSLSAYYQYEWQKNRLPAAGSYFGAADLLDAGGERLFVAPATAFFRGRDLSARNSGQWGISARYRAESIDTEFRGISSSLSRQAAAALFAARVGAGPALGKIGEYSLVYPENISLIGMSFSTTMGTAGVAGELHLRRNTPLASLPQVDPVGPAKIMPTPCTLSEIPSMPRYPPCGSCPRRSFGPRQPWLPRSVGSDIPASPRMRTPSIRLTRARPGALRRCSRQRISRCCRIWTSVSR